MNIYAITGSPSDVDPVAQQQTNHASPQKQSTPLPATGTQNIEDTVNLSQGAQVQSQGAQVQQLAQQGETPSIIANSTGLTVSEVDTDLGIPTPSTVPVAVPGALSNGHVATPSPEAFTAPHATTLSVFA